MTTQLAAQLQKLQQRPVDDKRLHSSFLFDKSDARSFSREEVLQLATVGLQTLVALDNRLHPFIEPLFHPSKTRQERQRLHTEAHQQLDRHIDHFLTLLSPHLLMVAAHQVFEYLVRVHEVHVYNIPSVLRAFLPYHDHSLFARVLLLLDLRDTGLDFLRTNQERGAPMLREHLVLACAESRKVLRTVCLAMAMPVRYKVHHNAANALFAAVATGLATHKDAEAHWRVLVPFVVEFLSGAISGSEVGAVESTAFFETGGQSSLSADREVVCTALVVLAAWSSEVTFSLQMMLTVVKPIIAFLQRASAHYAAVAPVSDLLALMDVLFQTQLRVVSEAAFTPHLNALLALPWEHWTDDIALTADAMGGVLPLEALITVLVRHGLDRLRKARSAASIPCDVMRFVRLAAEALPLSRRLVNELFSVLLSCESVLGGAAGEADEVESGEGIFPACISALERRYQHLFDTALARALSDPATSAAATAFLGRHLGGTRYQMVEVRGKQGERERLPLFACLMHPLPEVRTVAVGSLEDLSLDQLFVSTSSVRSAEEGPAGSLVELFAHAMRQEESPEVASAFLRVAASVAQKLLTAQPEPRLKPVYVTSMKALLMSSCSLFAMHDGSVALDCFKILLQPLLHQLKESVESPYRPVVLYSTVLLYITISHRGGATVAKCDAHLVSAMEDVLREHFEKISFNSDALALTTDLKPHSGTLSCSDDDEEKEASIHNHSTVTFPSVLACPEVLLAIYGHASERLPVILETAQRLLSDGVATAEQRETCALECSLAAASALVGDTSIASVTRLLRFLRGAGETVPAEEEIAEEADGYLVTLQKIRRREAAGVVSTEARPTIGRGAAKNQLVSPLLPRNSVTDGLAAAVQGAVRVAVASTRATSYEHLFLLLQVLGYVGSRLPPLSTNVESLPTPLFALLELHAAATAAANANQVSTIAVDWYQLVYDAVYGLNSGAMRRDFSIGALALVLLLPLRTPSAQREGLLQRLQDTVVRRMQAGGGGRGCTPNVSSAAMVIAAALASKKSSLTVSVTTLNALVESMAREELRCKLPTGAADLLCTMLADVVEDEGRSRPVVPNGLANETLQFFFPTASVSPSRGAGGVSLSLRLLLPRVRAILALGAGAIQAHTTKTAVYVAEPEEADFVEAVCRRGAIKGGSSPQEDAGFQLCVELLQRPFLRVRGQAGGMRPVYRHALTMLVMALQHGLDDTHQSPLIFTRAARKGKDSSSGEGSLSDTYVQAVAACVTPVLLQAADRIGSDVAHFCMGTTGGYHRVVLPFLESAEASEGLEMVAEWLEVVAPGRGCAAMATHSAWQPPAGCALSNPLTYAHLKRVLSLCHVCVEKEGWRREPRSALGLRVLSAAVRASPTVAYAEDDDGESLYHLMEALLTAYPLVGLLPLLRSEESGGALAIMEGSTKLLGAYARQVLTFLKDVTHVCVHQPRALSEKVHRGAYKLRGMVLQQGLVLLASLLLDSDPSDHGREGLPHHTIDLLTELLRTLSPLLGHSALEPTSSDPGEETDRLDNFLIHIPLVALMVRLEAVEYTEAMHYQGAAEVCQAILTSFDLPTQIMCLSQLMRLIIDPHGHLSSPSGGALSGGADAAEAVKGDIGEVAAVAAGDGDTQEVLHLLHKMVKPNQIVNRQETILHLIASTIKSDAFLGSFIEMQHTSRKGRREGDEDEGEGEGAVKRAIGGKGARGHDACMHLLVCTLELFSQYSDLNLNTVDDAHPENGAEREADAVVGEKKAYTMLLELLAGNTLACVMAGINEPTFVECLHRLLLDRRPSLQLKGLEVLLDRLHHSLPTVENTISDEEMERHRRELRDPKRKLTLMDLVRVKARPLTTKRSFSLFPHLTALLHGSLKAALSATRSVAPTEVDNHVVLPLTLPALAQLFQMAQLSVCCIEELVRIVGSGGSTQAEKTLLNVHRSKRVTEALLSKLFGNKSRVSEIHHFVSDLCEKLLPRLTQGMQTLYASSKHSKGIAVTAAVSTSSEGHLADAAPFTRLTEEGISLCMVSILTALGTIVQVMGSAFVLPHCTRILQTVVSAAVYQVVELPAVVTRSEAGSLLRHTTLSCLIRCFPSCWQMSQPFLSRVLFAASHLTNVDDAETNFLCSEMLVVLEALLEPQVFLDACTECLQGIRYVNTAVLSGDEQLAAMTAVTEAAATTKGAGRSAAIKSQVGTHSFKLFYSCIERSMQNLKKDELLHMSVVVEGSTAQTNFWLASMHALASGPSVPPSEVVLPVLNAYTAFFLKFKSKHCVRFLRTVAEWAFGGDSTSFTKSLAIERQGDNDDAAGDRDRGSNEVPRSVVQRWLLFYALYNHLLEKLGPILDFGFPVVLPYIVATLASYCSSGKAAVKAHASVIALTLEGALDSVRRMALAQTPAPGDANFATLDVYFASTEVFNALMPPLVHQLTNLCYLSDALHDYLFRVEHGVIPSVRAFFACLGTNKLQSKAQAELIRGLRHPSRHVRRATLVCLDGIYADGGEELASRLMAEMLPPVVELTEDRDDAVVEEARKLCTNLSNMTGQDVLHALS